MGDAALTTVLVVGAALVLSLWDVYAAFGNRVPNSKDTISGQIKAAGKNVRGLPFAFGVLGGHFFWGGEPLLPRTIGIWLLVSCALLISGPRWFRIDRLVLPMPVALALGVVCGRLFWPQ